MVGELGTLRGMQKLDALGSHPRSKNRQMIDFQYAAKLLAAPSRSARRHYVCPEFSLHVESAIRFTAEVN